MGLSTNVTIRRGEPRDAATIADFNSRMAWETEHKRLDAEIVGRGVSRVFDDAAKGFIPLESPYWFVLLIAAILAAVPWLRLR